MRTRTWRSRSSGRPLMWSTPFPFPPGQRRRVPRGGPEARRRRPYRNSIVRRLEP
uniref:Uncharacterized protein n=1 Tax=Arundo donax TaxID=35708 RepID=A0A0A8YNT3_ARUDO